MDPESDNLKQAEQSSEFEDVKLTCIDCNEEFNWTSGEQTFFRDKGLTNPPKRCRPCKQAKNRRLEAVNSPGSGPRPRVEVSVNCARCEQPTTVPFYPSQGRPVFCRSCFLEMNPDVLGKS